MQFQKNETVRIVEGPFQDITGVVDEIYADSETLKVMINVVGHSTPVELGFKQVEKVLG